MEEAYASSGRGFRAPESLKGSFAGIGSELARGRSSVKEVRGGREDLLHGTWCPQRQVGSPGFAQGRWCLHFTAAASGRVSARQKKLFSTVALPIAASGGRALKVDEGPVLIDKVEVRTNRPRRRSISTPPSLLLPNQKPDKGVTDKRTNKRTPH